MKQFSLVVLGLLTSVSLLAQSTASQVRQRAAKVAGQPAPTTQPRPVQAAPAAVPAQPAQPALAQPADGKYQNINVAQFDRYRTNANYLVLDVRTKSEFDSGHVPGALNLDVNSADFAKRLGGLDKSKTYLVHCAAGVRSVKACKTMAAFTFPNLMNLEGGYSEWEKVHKDDPKKPAAGANRP